MGVVREEWLPHKCTLRIVCENEPLPTNPSFTYRSMEANAECRLGQLATFRAWNRRRKSALSGCHSMKSDLRDNWTPARVSSMPLVTDPGGRYLQYYIFLNASNQAPHIGRLWLPIHVPFLPVTSDTIWPAPHALHHAGYAGTLGGSAVALGGQEACRSRPGAHDWWRADEGRGRAGYMQFVSKGQFSTRTAIRNPLHYQSSGC